MTQYLPNLSIFVSKFSPCLKNGKNLGHLNWIDGTNGYYQNHNKNVKGTKHTKAWYRKIPSLYVTVDRNFQGTPKIFHLSIFISSTKIVYILYQWTDGFR